MSPLESLDVDNAASYLVERGFVDPTLIVDGDLRIRSELRRNRNLRVTSRRGPGYLVKQPEPGTGGEQTLATEARFYQHCFEDAPAVAACLPRWVDFNEDGSRLILELLPGAHNFDRELSNHDPESFPSEPWSDLGRILGTVDATFRAALLQSDPFLTGLPAAPPWILESHSPRPRVLERLSAAHRRTLRIVQKDEGMTARFADLAATWKVDTVIHGDIRFDNVLVLPADSPGSALRLVDWELVQRGDPAWDVAGVLQSVLIFWIQQMPTDPEMDAGERVAAARYPLDALQPAVRAFWSAWWKASGRPPEDAAEVLRRAVAYSAARLVQSSFELGASRDRLLVVSVLMLQVASNILADPEQAAFQLYGLHPPTAGYSA